MKNIERKQIYKGQEITIYYDQDPFSPDEWGDTESFIVYDHRQFYINREGYNPDDIWERYQTHKTYDGYWIFPLYAYIHSGVNLSLRHNGDRWDTSMKGFALVKREKGWTWNKHKATKVAEGMVNTWNQYLSGDVYGYEVDGESCSGYYGDEGIEEAIREAEAIIDYNIKAQTETHVKRLKRWIKSKVDIIYRKPLTIN